MKHFTFSLERVRRWRREQASLEELKLQQFRAEMDRLASAQLEIASEGERSAQQILTKQSLDPLELTSLESYRLHLRHRIRQLQDQERQCEARVLEQRQRVIEARRKLELLDRLHDKAFEAWRAAADKEYEDLAAELFLAKSARKN